MTCFAVNTYITQLYPLQFLSIDQFFWNENNMIFDEFQLKSIFKVLVYDKSHP